MLFGIEFGTFGEKPGSWVVLLRVPTQGTCANKDRSTLRADVLMLKAACASSLSYPKLWQQLCKSFRPGEEKGEECLLIPFFLVFEELLQTLHDLSLGCFEAPAPEQTFVGFSCALGVTPQNKAQLIYIVLLGLVP